MATYAALPDPGVVRPDHLRVLVLSGSTLGITPGAAVVPAGTSGSARWQAYVAAVESTSGDAVVPVPMPSASARTLHVVVVVPDPQWAGVPAPDDPLSSAYAQLQVLTSAQLGSLTVPHLVLARVSIPANATSLTQGMVTDLRRVSRPQQWTDVFSHRLTGNDRDQLLASGPGGEQWPDAFTPTVYVPPWATQVAVSLTLYQVLCPGGAFSGAIWVRIGSTGTGFTTLEVPIQADIDTRSRQTFGLAATLAVPELNRGADQGVRIFGRINPGAAGAVPELRAGSGVDVSLTWREAPA